MTGNSIFSRLLSRLASLEVALAILLLLGLTAIPGTFLENRQGYYGSSPFLLLLVLLGLSLLVCTLRRWRRLATGVLVVHLGMLVILGGFVVREVTGVVATVNLYPGDTVSRFYIPDRDREAELGFSLQVQRVVTEYHPVPLKIGVLRGAAKQGLYTVKTGGMFMAQGYRGVVERFNRQGPSVQMTVYAGEARLGTVDTAGNTTLPGDFPLKFKLVAYQDPQISRSALELQTARSNEPPLNGSVEVNQPLSRYGFDFYYVQHAFDRQGREYVGIQIVRDLGRPIVFLGMALAAVGAVMVAFRRLHGVVG